MSPAVEQQLRRAARSFPRRWRNANEDELVATASDMLPEGATEVPFAVVADIVRAGWGERWRSRPSVPRWLWYAAGGKLPARDHAWLCDDLDGRLYWLRAAVRRFVVIAASWFTAWGLMNATNDTSQPMPWFALVGFTVLVPVSWLLRNRMRRQVRKQHALLEGGAPAAPAIVWLPARTPSVGLRPAAAATAVWSTIVAVALAAEAAALDDHAVVTRSLVVGAAVALVTGAVWTAVVRHRVRERVALVPRRPPMRPAIAAGRIAAGLALATGGVGLAWFQFEPGPGFPNAAVLAWGAMALAAATTGTAVVAGRMCVADVIASPEQLAWLKRQELVAAG